MSWKTRWETGWETRSTKYEGKHANRSSLIVILSSLSLSLDFVGDKNENVWGLFCSSGFFLFLTSLLLHHLFTLITLLQERERAIIVWLRWDTCLEREDISFSHSPASLASVYLSFDENDEVLLCSPLPFLLCLSMCLRVIHSLNHSSFTHLHPFSVILRKKKKQSSSAENKPTKLCLSLRKCLFSLVKCLSTDDDVKLETPSNSTWQRQSMQRQKEMKEDRKEKTPADSRLEIV